MLSWRILLLRIVRDRLRRTAAPVVLRASSSIPKGVHQLFALAGDAEFFQPGQ